MEPSKAPRFETTSLESLPAAAGAWIVASELLFELLISMDDSHSAFDVCFRWVTASSLTHGLESSGLRCARVRIALVRSQFEYSTLNFSKCSRQESNLVFDLRRVACVPAHSENNSIGTLKCQVTRPGIEPGPTVSKTVMLSSTPASHVDWCLSHKSRRLGSHQHKPLYKSGAFLSRATSA